jgi:hypothetical protein
MKLSTRRRVKRLLTDEQKRWIKANSKTLSVEEMAIKLGITTKQTIDQCGKIYCSYFRKETAA